MSTLLGITIWLKDIRFWIILFFIVRLVGITNPALEVGHNWRQATVTMVARNFVEVDADVMHPRIDIAGEKTGITGMEFPLLNYLMYRVALVFGYNHWQGRLINLLISSLGIFYFTRLVQAYWDKRTALYAGIILLTSIWFSFSRKIMPDTFAVSLVMMGLYYAHSFLNCRAQRYPIMPLLSSVALVMLGTLAKLPACVVLAPLALMIPSSTASAGRKTGLVIGMAIAGAPAYFWYFHWAPQLVEDYGFWHFFMGTSMSVGAQELYTELGQTLKRFYDTPLKFSGFAVFLLGIYFMITKRKSALGLCLLLVAIPFFIIMIKAGNTFSHHSYYIIPFVPIMALIAAYGLSQIPKQGYAYALLALIIIEGVANQAHDFRIKEEHPYLSLEADLDQVSERDDLILIDSGEYPTPMYFAHRKGWVLYTEEVAGRIDSLSQHGLSYVVTLADQKGHKLGLTEERVFSGPKYDIYKVNTQDR